MGLVFPIGPQIRFRSTDIKPNTVIKNGLKMQMVLADAGEKIQIV